MVDMQSDEVCLHPSSVWPQVAPGRAVHAIRVTCAIVTRTDCKCPQQQQCSTLVSHRSTWPDAKAPLWKFSKVPPLLGQKRRQLRLYTHVSKPGAAFLDQQYDQIRFTNIRCQSPNNSIHCKHSTNHTNTVQHILSIPRAQAFSSFYLRMVHNLARLQPLLDTEQYFFLDHACAVRR